jgi:protein-tyrosine phosphatase
MGEALLRAHLRASAIPATVGSAGLLPGGAPATREAIDEMAAWDLDISAHRSRRLSRELVAATPLVVGMARRHVREAVVTYGARIERTFTLKELVRRGEKVGPRGPSEPVSAWLGRVGVGRVVSDLMGEDENDDVADPIGRPRSAYEVTLSELDDLIYRLVDLMVGTPVDTERT